MASVNLFMLIVALLLKMVVADPMEYCQWETFKAKCAPNEVIIIKSAQYGRIRYGRCIERDYGYVGCTTDVLLMTDLRCSGRHECGIKIPDERFDRAAWCPNDLVKYLLVDYFCKPVISPTRQQCISQPMMLLTEPSGVIASVTARDSGCGSTEWPWLIQGRPGQTISISMTDFALKPALINDTQEGEDTSSLLDNHCHVYAILKERHAQPAKSTTICGGRSRVSDVYVSTTSEVEVRIITGKQGRERHFLLEYTLSGCADVQAPPGGWLERDNDVITAGCADRKNEWTLRCEGNVWKGQRGNCTAATIQRQSLGNLSFPQTLSIVVILAVAVGIGAVILCVGLFCIKRRRNMSGGPEEAYVTTGPRPCAKDSLYRTANSPYNGYTPPSSIRNDMEENDYEYVDDLIRPPVAPSADPKTMQGDPKINRADSKSVRSDPKSGRGDPKATRARTASESCAVHRGNTLNQYTKYGTNNQPEPGKGPSVPGPNKNHSTISYSMPPQYFELDPEVVGGGVKGNVYQGHTRVAAHGGSQQDARQDQERQQNLSFGHYSQ